MIHVSTRWPVVVALLAWPSLLHAETGPIQLAELMHLLAQHPPGRATFVERRRLALLDRPVESSGELVFTPPDHIEKRTLKPKPALLVLDGDALTLERPDQRPMQVSLRDHPEVAAFVESVRGTLAGDQAALDHNYRIELTGTWEQWQLQLEPRTSPLMKILRRIRIGGSQAEIRRIDFDQADGDQSTMHITHPSDP